MSFPSHPAPVPPPAPPPPPPIIQFDNNNFGNKSALIKVSDQRRNGEAVLGQTETKIIPETHFVEEVHGLINRLPYHIGSGTENVCNTKADDSSCNCNIKLAVTLPLRKTIQQNGPMCGIVALAEALQLLNDKEVVPKEILDEAVKMGFTKQGEMFSVDAMLTLAKTIGDCNKARILTDTKDINQLTEAIAHILEGYPALIPYDADFNHSPSLREGHSAHWAVIYGIACRIPEDRVSLFRDSPVFKCLQASQDVLIVQPLRANVVATNMNEVGLSSMNELVTKLFNYETVHIIAHQGKSFHPAVWKFMDLMKSNQNLKKISPKILNSKSDYICEDIVNGLCSKMLLLK